MEGRGALTSWNHPDGGYVPPGVTLTRRFYAWELRGRGWHLWPYPVPLEPPFFEFRHELLALPVRDDGRSQGVFESIAAYFSTPVTTTLPALVAPEDEFARHPSRGDTPDFVELHVAVPKTVHGSRDMMEQFLLVTTAAGALGFEIVGTKERIVLQLVAATKRARQVTEQLKGHFPGVVVTSSPGYLADTWREAGGASVVVDFGLSQEFMRPLKGSGNFSPDPLVAIISALEGLGEGEVGVFQVLCARGQNPWPESVLRAVTGAKGESFIEECPELPGLAREKLRGVMFAAAVRVAASAEQEARAWQIVQGLGAALETTRNPGSNELIPLTNDGFPDADHEEDLLARTSHRCGMLLSSHELMTLVHLPTPAVASRSLARTGKKTAPAPKIAKPVDCVLGTNTHEGKTVPVGLDSERRLQHLYVVGGSGTGKSTLLRNLIVQDILAGRGCAVLDPHGDLVDDVLRYIPTERLDHVVLFDPADTDCPVGFNVLQARSELEKNLLISDLVSVFKRFATSWGDQMSTVLGNAISAFLEHPKGGTLADLRRFLLEKEYRREILLDVADVEVRSWWERQFPLLKGVPAASILTRLDAFLRPKPVRYVVAQRAAALDLGAIMREGKVFLGKLSQGLIGEENAHLLGSLIVSKFHQCALARQAEAKENRRDFFLYLDEFHHFVSPSMAAILSGARKYKLGLTLAHQELRQLAERDRELLASVMSNAYTRVMFRVGDEDARKLADGLSSFDAKDLQNLGRGEAILRVERTENDCNLATEVCPDWLEETDPDTPIRIRDLTREKYGCPKETIETELRVGSPPPPPASKRADAPLPDDTATSREDAPEPRAGKGGSLHKELQQRVKRFGEARGYRATIEKPVAGGRIDVALESDDGFIAFEISVTTNVLWETGNVEKCLAAGATRVLVVAADSPACDSLRAHLDTALPTDKRTQVECIAADELDVFFDALDPLPGALVRGWKVELLPVPLDEELGVTKRKSIIRRLLDVLTRLVGRVFGKREE